MSVEHFDVLIVGAGISGIGAGYHLQNRCPSRRYAILEGRGDLGGTWGLFRYPGVRSDSDMFTLGYSFRPWKEARAIADGPAILNYLRETAHEFGIDRHIRFQQRVRSASWSSGQARWTVEAEVGEHREPVRYTCNFLFLCSGYYDYEEGYLPAFAGREDFQGQLDPSATLARGPRLPRPADRGDRQRRHGGDAGPRAGRDRGARDHAPALPLVHPLRPRGGRPRPGDPPILAGAGRSPAHPLEECPPVPLLLSAVPSEARAGEAALAPRPGQGAAARLRHRYALQAALRALGSAPLPGARRRPVPGDAGRARLGGHRRGGEVHPARDPAQVRPGTPGRRHRHGDRPEPPGLGRHPPRSSMVPSSRRGGASPTRG